MGSIHLVDPELRPLLDASAPVDISPEALPATRAALAEYFASATQSDGLPVSVAETYVPGPAQSQVRTFVIRPIKAAGPLPALLHVHGGGYVMGSPEMTLPANRRLAAELSCVVYSVDYRLAPETPYPGGLDDCYAVLEWLAGEADREGIDASRIGVKGESAGGGLAAAIALTARDRGGPKLAFQHLIYPMIDDRSGVAKDPHPFCGEFQWTRELSHRGWTALLGDRAGGTDVPDRAAPARCEDLTGLPATFISVGALDLFLEEDMDYARRLTRAGVPVELHVYPGAFHGFDLMANARVAQAAERDSLAALRRAFHG